MSFIYVGIYWNNHHHRRHGMWREWRRSLGQPAPAVLAVALLPFATGWMGENHVGPWRCRRRGCGVLAAAAVDHPPAGRGLATGARGGRRLERQALAGDRWVVASSRCLRRAGFRSCCMRWRRCCGWCRIGINGRWRGTSRKAKPAWASVCIWRGASTSPACRRLRSARTVLWGSPSPLGEKVCIRAGHALKRGDSPCCGPPNPSPGGERGFA